MKLSKELAAPLRGGAPGTVVAYLTTSLRDGRTNMLPIPFTDVVDDELVLMPDLFAQKTRVSLNENALASLSFTGPDGSPEVVIEGRAGVIQWGHPRTYRLFGLSADDVLDRWGDWDETVEPVIDAADEAVRPSVFAQRGVIVFRPERIVEVDA